MATKKAIKFAAPYRSSTFNDAHSLMYGLNGVVSGGKVTTSGIIATIQPLTFLQNGLLVTIDTTSSATIPTGLTAPYSIAVSVSSSVENLAEVITPVFVKRPQDVSANTVIVADWDGFEWVSRPKVQISELIKADQIRSLAHDFVGVSSGFDVSKDGPDVAVSSGSLIDRQGALFTKETATTFTPVANDFDGLGRIDEVLYRKPDDSSARVGTIKCVLGQTYNATDTVSVLHTTAFGNNTLVNLTGKTLVVPSTNQSLFLYKEDYADRARLNLVAADDDMSSVSAATTLASDFEDFDAILNPDGSIDLVYTRSNKLFYQRVSSAGVSIFPELEIASHSVVVAQPRLVSVKSGATYFLHVVYKVATTGSNHQLYYVRLSAANTIETAQVLLVSLSALLNNPSLEKDDDDSLLFLAFENASTERAYLRQYDASTVTALAPPTQVGTSVELQDDTYITSSLAMAPTTGATQPIVKRTDNKETFVFWRHHKGSGNYGIAIYSDRYLDDFGHKAIITDLVAPGEHIDLYDVDVDAMNAAHFIAASGGDVVKASLKLPSLSALGPNGTLGNVLPTALSVKLNARGSLVHSWSEASPGYQNNGNPAAVEFMGPGSFGVSAELIAANEFVILRTTGNILSPGYDDLSPVPTLGDQITISGSGANDGTYNWTSARIFTDSGNDYVAVSTDGTFVSTPSGPAAQFSYQQGSDIWFAKTNSGVSSNLRGFDVLRTDVFLAHHRVTDGVLSVSGPSIEESDTITRLYEFINCFAGGGGQATWEGLGPELLSFDGPFQVRFFNRRATYTINAVPAGITIAADQVAYVQIPDSDENATLSIQVADFGAGILDRYGRNTYPLFWHIGGVLYTRFAPFRIESGQTIVVGDHASQQLMDWLGISSSTPDPSNHGYTHISGAGLLQSDTPIQAISKLDAMVAGFNGGVESVPNGATQVSIVFAVARANTNYSVLPVWSNLLDAEPQFQPIVVTDKQTTGFTAKWNAPTDSANYSVEYIVRDI